MSDDTRVRAELRALLDPFLDKLIDKYGLEAVKQAVEAALSRPPGRPKGWAIDDWAALENMYRLLQSGLASDRTDAARQSLHLTEVHGKESTVRRLRDKYKEHKDEIALRVTTGDITRGIHRMFEEADQARRALMEPAKQAQRAMASIAEAQDRALKEFRAAVYPILRLPTEKN